MSEPTHPTRDTLSLLLRAELDAAAEQDAVEHLRTCSACARALREEAALDVALLHAHAQHPAHEPGPAAAPVTPTAIRRRRTRQAIWATGAALAAGVVAWLLLAPLRTREDAPATPATARTAELCLAHPGDAACQATQDPAAPTAPPGPAEPAPSDFGVEVR